MSSNSKTSVSKAQNELHKRVLSGLLKQDDNRKCCDCLSRGPTWASVNMGMFMCLNCSGIHRSLGVHLSKVRSTNLDTWLPEQVDFVSRMGNRKGNLFWEARLPSGFRRPAEGDMMALKTFITDKYQNQTYVDPSFREAPTMDNWPSHPFMKQFEEGADAGVTPVAGGADRAADAANAGSQTPPAAKAPAARSGGVTPVPTLAGPAGSKPVTPAAPAPALMDLLSLEDGPPTAAPTAAAQGGVQAPAATDDGDWAAWGDTQHSVPAVTAPPPDAAAAPPAAQEEDGGWDAFQGGDTGPTAAATAGAPVSSPAPSTDDPFAAWTSAPTAAATPASAAPAAAAAGDKGSSAGLSSAPAVGPKHSQKRSAEDIMKMFDMPQQGLGPQPGQQGQGQGQQQMGLFGGSGVGQPGGMAGMTPQQMMQAQQMYAVQMQQMAANMTPQQRQQMAGWVHQQHQQQQQQQPQVGGAGFQAEWGAPGFQPFPAATVPGFGGMPGRL